MSGVALFRSLPQSNVAVSVVLVPLFEPIQLYACANRTIACAKMATEVLSSDAPPRVNFWSTPGRCTMRVHRFHPPKNAPDY